MAELNAKLLMKKAVPRVLKATVWGSLTFFVVYCLPMMLYPTDILPFDYAAQLGQFATIVVFFAVAGQLFSGTLIGCGFGIAKAILIIAYFFTISDNGIFSLNLSVSEVTVNFAIDISVILLMIISVNLFNIAKNLLEALTLLTEKSTDIDLT